MVHELRRPELYGRLEPTLIVFDLIRPEIVPRLCEVLLGRLAENSRERLGISLHFDTEGIANLVRDELAAGSYRYGGRAVRSVLEREVLAPLKSWILEQRLPRPTDVLAACDSGALEFRAEGPDRRPAPLRA